MAALRVLRRQAGWSQRDLAHVAGVSPQTVALLEGRKQEPRPSTMRRIAAVLQVPITAIDEFCEEPGA
jgi:transcriptional regulator with XRE-family HTH domain